MKRITMRDTISKIPRWFLLCWRMCIKNSCERCDYMSKAINRLGEIEDILGEEYDLNYLRKLIEINQNKKDSDIIS